MTRAEKISAIYAEMANKEETFWCKVLVDTQKRFRHRLESESGIEDTIIGKIRDPDDFRKFNLEDNWPSYDDWQRSNIDEEEFTCITEVIWHPVMIWDVMEYLENKSQSQIVEHEDDEDEDWFYSREDYYEDVAEISDCWKDKRLSIDEQSDECVDFVYSLISKGNE